LGTVAAVIGIAPAYLIGTAIGVPLSFAAYLAAIGGAVLLTLLPISIAGWGVREAAVVSIFGTFGVPAEQALVVSVLFGLSLTVAAIPGGLLLLLSQPAEEPSGQGE